jgi:hypothetical protein
MKLIVILIAITIARTSVSQNPIVILRDGTLVHPTPEKPLTEEQLSQAMGNVFWAKSPVRTCLTTAEHVAKALRVPYRGEQTEGVDIAALLEPAEVAPADAIDVAPYRDNVDVTVIAWSILQNREVRVTASPTPLTSDFRVTRDLWEKTSEERPDVPLLSAWRTAKFDRPNRAIAHRDGTRLAPIEQWLATLIGPGCSGGLVTQKDPQGKDRAVGVVVVVAALKGREQVMFQTLVPSARRPRGVPEWATPR